MLNLRRCPAYLVRFKERWAMGRKYPVLSHFDGPPSIASNGGGLGLSKMIGGPSVGHRAKNGWPAVLCPSMLALIVEKASGGPFIRLGGENGWPTALDGPPPNPLVSGALSLSKWIGGPPLP